MPPIRHGKATTRFLPFKSWPWQNFDRQANDKDIGRHAFPPLGANFKNKDLHYDWEAPVAITGDGGRSRRNQDATDDSDEQDRVSGKIWVKWNEYCSCFNCKLVTEDLTPEDARQINAHLKVLGFKSSHDLPKGKVVYFEDAFVDAWRRRFFSEHPELPMWKLCRIRRDVGSRQCGCPPAVRNHPELPPFKTSGGEAIRHPKPEFNYAKFYWKDPKP